MTDAGEASEDADSPLQQLLENNLDMLAAPSEQSIKGIRENIKKVWFAIGQCICDDFGIDLIEAIIVAVVGDDGSSRFQNKKSNLNNRA